MFHIEMRQSTNKAWRFNLTEAELRAVVIPWAREQWIEFGERKWNPHESEIKILEGPELPIEELSMGRGWSAAQRRSEDITERVVATIRNADVQRAATQATAAGQPSRGVAGSPDQLMLGVQLAALLGPEPTRLLAVWQEAALDAPGLPPSETLAQAERALVDRSGNPS